MIRSKIVSVNFTYALKDGMWIKREDDSCSWQTHSALQAELGEAEYKRIRSIAYHDGMTGMWYSV